MATGTAIIDFGAFPGSVDASVAVTGQANILTGSLVEAWITPADSADHSADEHMLEQFKVFVDLSSIVAGTGFTIKAFATNEKPEMPLGYLSSGQSKAGNAGALLMPYGKFNIGWAGNYT